jgi:hypothetical protein
MGRGVMRYTNPREITGMRVTDIPRHGQTVSGYGGAIPTRYMLEYKGYWRRVYAMAYANSATLYVRVKGEIEILDTDTEYLLMDMRND